MDARTADTFERRAIAHTRAQPVMNRAALRSGIQEVLAVPARKPVHIFSVFTNYADGRAIMSYSGSSERLAAWHFYKAVRDAQAASGVFMVSMHRDGKVTMRVFPEQL